MRIFKLIKKAERTAIVHDTACAELCVELLQLISDDTPKDDIFVFNQHGDGLVLAYKMLNVPVDVIVQEYAINGLLSWSQVLRLGI